VFRIFVACSGGAALVAGCLVSFEDYPTGSPDASNGAGGSTADGSWPTGGSSSTGGSSGSSGGGAGGTGAAGGIGGAISDAGDGTAGTSPVDASPDQTSSACASLGFWTTPMKPTSPSFALYFEHDQPLACIEFVVTCGAAKANLSGFDAGACPSKPYCWATSVTNCPPGSVTVQFIHEKDLNGTGDCNAFFPGSPGSTVATCEFELTAP
jgi:hypothetical protein